jgi:hypothetical protein
VNLTSIGAIYRSICHSSAMEFRDAARSAADVNKMSGHNGKKLSRNYKGHKSARQRPITYSQFPPVGAIIPANLVFINSILRTDARRVGGGIDAIGFKFKHRLNRCACK